MDQIKGSLQRPPHLPLEYVNKRIQVSQLVLMLSIFEGLRPFGVSILYTGWDKHYGYQLYQSDPSGNYSGWKATCIGNNSVVSVVVYVIFRGLLLCAEDLFPGNDVTF